MGETDLYTDWIGSIGWFLYTYYYAVCTNTSLVDGSTLITFPSVKQGLLMTLDAETYLCRNFMCEAYSQGKGSIRQAVCGDGLSQKILNYHRLKVGRGFAVSKDEGYHAWIMNIVVYADSKFQELHVH